MNLLEYADFVLHEWAMWQAENVIRCGWPKSTSFGRAIKPDSVPAREPIDDERAFKTDLMLAKLPKRVKRLVRIHYLSHAPIDSRARLLRMSRENYKASISGVHRVVAICIAADARKAYMQVDCRNGSEAGAV